MHFARATNSAALVLLLGTLVPAYAQHEQKDEKQGKPEKQQQSQQQHAQQPQQKQAQQQHAQQPQQKQTHQQQPQQQRAQQSHQQPPPPQHAQQSHHQQPQRTQQQAVAWQKQRGWVQQGGGWQGQSTWQQSSAQQWNGAHRTWAQRGGYGGYYIPQDRYVLYFGNQHSFRMHSRPTIYMGYPRFSYGGYSFLLLDPWPSNWGENWYGTDDVYIDYNNGYYLYNRRHPGFGLAITVAL